MFSINFNTGQLHLFLSHNVFKTILFYNVFLLLFSEFILNCPGFEVIILFHAQLN